MAVVQRHNLPDKILIELTKNNNQAIARIAIKTLPNNTFKYLKFKTHRKIIGNQSDFEILINYIAQKVCLHKVEISPETLVIVAKTRGWQTGVAIVRDPNTPIAVLQKLAKSTNTNLRHAVANQKKLDLDTIKILLNDSDNRVRQTALNNIIQNYSNLESDLLEQISIAKNSNTKKEKLAELSKSNWTIINKLKKINYLYYLRPSAFICGRYFNLDRCIIKNNLTQQLNSRQKHFFLNICYKKNFQMEVLDFCDRL